MLSLEILDEDSPHWNLYQPEDDHVPPLSSLQRKLWQASSTDDAAGVARLAAAPGVDVNAGACRRSGCRTALHIAAVAGAALGVRALLDAGAEVRAAGAEARLAACDCSGVHACSAGVRACAAGRWSSGGAARLRLGLTTAVSGGPASGDSSSLNAAAGAEACLQLPSSGKHAPLFQHPQMHMPPGRLPRPQGGNAAAPRSHVRVS